MAAVDSSQGGFGQPASFALAITPDNDNDLANVSRALAIGAGGTLRVTMFGNAQVVNFTVVNGAILPIRVTRVHSTGTTATGIVNLW